jgi:hypothetical protein
MEQLKAVLEDGSFITAEARSGGGGTHRYYKLRKGTVVPSTAGVLAPGLDIRARGGYVVAPPSVHASGASYEWIGAGLNSNLAEFPESLRVLYESKRNKGETWNSNESGKISEGGRNQYLASVAGGFRKNGLGVDDAKRMMRQINEIMCDPPVPESELRKTVDKSIERWKQGVVDSGPGLFLPDNILQADANSRLSDPVNYLIRPLIPSVGLALMHGKGSVGKSTFASFVTAKATLRDLRVLLRCSE